jgi:RimJ/RimL family protein N-acetyltransferase
MIDYRELRKEDMPIILKWRNDSMETLRTPYKLTLEQQMHWYNNTICDRQSNTRYWAFTKVGNDEIIGFGGIENVIWEYRTGEISILIGKEFRRLRYGECAVLMILSQAFNSMNMHNIWGECYTCGNTEFWKKILGESNYKIEFRTLPNRKYYNGLYWDSLYFNIGGEYET